jgi:hypothetical protein
MAKSYQVVIEGIVWCGAYHITKFGSIEFQGFPHLDYEEEQLEDLLRKLRGQNK